MADIKKNRAMVLAVLLGASALAARGTEVRATGLVPPSAETAKAETAVIPPSAVTIPFAEAASALTLSGEDDSVAVSFWLSAREAAEGGNLRLAYINAVSVLPETASVSVAVNGQPAGSFAVRSPNGITTETLALGPAMLKPGRNRVVLRALQHHRVDCSLEATYELWTRFDPAESGFVPLEAPRFETLGDLARIGRKPDGVTDIRLVAPASDPGLMTLAAMAAQTLALALDRPDVTVSIGEGPGEGPGIDLAVSLGAGTTPGLAVLPSGQPGRARVELAAGDAASARSLLAEAVKSGLSTNLQEGILTPRSGEMSGEADSVHSLAETGYRTAPFTGRLMRHHFNLRMPADFYPADYATVGLDLDAATAPGLAPGAQLLVRVNDRIVRSFPFRSAAGEVFTGKRIELPLRNFRPGENRVEMIAELPVAADAACTPGNRGEEKPRFMLLDTTRISVPTLARIARLPDLAALAGTGYPFADGKPFSLHVPGGGKVGLETALTLTARLSLAARRPLNPVIGFDAPDEAATGHRLVIAEGQPVSEAPAVLPDLDQLQTSAVPLAPAAVVPAATDADQLIAAFRETTAGEEGSGAFTSLSDRLFQASARFRRWLAYDEAPAGGLSALDGAHLVTLTQQPAPSGEGSLTRIEAASPEALGRGATALFEPAVMSRLEGGSAAIRAVDLGLVTRPATSRFVTSLPDMGPANLRRLVASWFSDHFAIYVLTVLALTGGFGLWLSRVVPKKGVRTDA